MRLAGRRNGPSSRRQDIRRWQQKGLKKATVRFILIAASWPPSRLGLGRPEGRDLVAAGVQHSFPSIPANTFFGFESCKFSDPNLLLPSPPWHRGLGGGCETRTLTEVSPPPSLESVAISVDKASGSAGDLEIPYAVKCSVHGHQFASEVQVGP